jgi:tetratricopeptide (TPR) repeat protein
VNLSALSWGSRFKVSPTLELMGDADAAEREMLAVWSHFRSTRGEASSLAMRAAADLAHFCCDHGRWEEAADYLTYGEEVDRSPPPHGKIYAFRRLAARARIASNAGNHAAALELVQTAVELAAAFGNLDYEARVWLSRAEVERAAGDLHAAEQSVARGLVLYDRKGNTAAAAIVRAVAL